VKPNPMIFPLKMRFIKILAENYGSMVMLLFASLIRKIVYSTYLGGDSEDIGYNIAVDLSGNAYLTGKTIS
jgi:hypothetical protein